MTRVRVDFEQAHLLSQQPYRETSALVEAFSARHGRIGLVARGVHGPKARQRGVLRPFAPLLLSWTGSGDLATLIGAETAGMPVPLTGERIFFGWYLNELLLRLLQRHVPHPALYADYEAAMARLPAADAEGALRIFEKRLLAELGYGLPLDADFDAGRRYRFDSEHGSFGAGAADDPRAYPGAHLIALRDENLGSREVLRDARRLLRTALARQLGGRELETPKLLRAMRRGYAGNGVSEPDAGAAATAAPAVSSG